MITLITGGPGTGKTAWVLAELLKLRKAEPEKELYIHGVRNLRGLPHEQIYCRSQLCDICRSKDIPQDAKFVEDWPEWKVPGSLIVVDEVQRIWRPRAGSSNIPESVSGLETHRHYGLDFWLISQGPHLFDAFIRLLVGKHIHLLARWNGRSQYEWPECQQNIQSRSDAVVRPYSLPKHVYKMYDSAEVHTKQNKRMPLSIYAMVAASIVALILIFRAYSSISSKIEGKPAQASAGSPSGSSLQQNNSGQSGQGVVAPVPSLPVPFPDFKPRLPGVPESAPAYAGLIQVTTAPLLAGCIKTKTECKCYTDQATPYPVSETYCTEVIAGHRFNPYKKKNEVNPISVEQPIDSGSAVNGRT